MRKFLYSKIFGETSRVLAARFVMILAAIIIFEVASATSTPRTFTYQGRLMNAAGTAPLTGSLTLVVQIYEDEATPDCVMLSERHSITTADGLFSITIGAGTKNNSYSTFEDDPSFSHPTWDLAYSFNNLNFSSNPSQLTTPDCPMQALSANAQRKLRLHVFDGSTWAQLADQTITSVPQAVVAETLQGREAIGFTQSWTTATRPSNPQNNVTGFNATTNRVERWTGAAWESVTPRFSTTAINNNEASVTDNYIMKWNDATKVWEPAAIGTLLGAVAGDLTGTWPNITVVGLQGRDVDSAAPADGQVLKWVAANSRWEPAADAGGIPTFGTPVAGYHAKFYDDAGTMKLRNSILSDNGTTLYAYGDLVMNQDATDRNIDGLAAPTTDKQAANKKYVDDQITANAIADGTVAGQTMRWDGTNWVATSAVFIDGSGNVGIGNSAPGSRLSISGNITFPDTGGTGTYSIGRMGYNDVLNLNLSRNNLINSTANDMYFGTYDRYFYRTGNYTSAGGTNAMVLNREWIGNHQFSLSLFDDRMTFTPYVAGGLTPTRPLARMQTAHSAQKGIVLTGFAGQTENLLDINSNGNTGGNLLNVSSQGNVGIGTATPNERLTLNGVLSLAETTAPTATAGFSKIYVKADNGVYYMDESGTESQFVFGTGAGETNTASNRGAPAADNQNIFHQKSGVDFEFKRLKEGTGITLTSDADYITINAASSLASGDATNRWLAWDNTNSQWEPAQITAASDVTSTYDDAGNITTTVTKLRGRAIDDGVLPTENGQIYFWDQGNTEWRVTDATPLIEGNILRWDDTDQEWEPAVGVTIDNAGYVTLPGLPTANDHAATKAYIDARVDSDVFIEEGTVTGQTLVWDDTASDWKATSDLFVDETNNRVGIGTTSPEFKLSLENDGGIIAKGTNGSGATLTTSGAGTRMIWYPRKSAFRAGLVSGTQWDNSSVGDISFAVGYDNIASGMFSASIGSQNNSSSTGGITIGSGNHATGTGALALGNYAISSGQGAIAMGFNNTSES